MENKFSIGQLVKVLEPTEDGLWFEEVEKMVGRIYPVESISIDEISSQTVFNLVGPHGKFWFFDWELQAVNN